MVFEMLEMMNGIIVHVVFLIYFDDRVTECWHIEPQVKATFHEWLYLFLHNSLGLIDSKIEDIEPMQT